MGRLQFACANRAWVVCQLLRELISPTIRKDLKGITIGTYSPPKRISAHPKMGALVPPVPTGLDPRGLWFERHNAAQSIARYWRTYNHQFL